jgi:hypothetical protein
MKTKLFCGIALLGMFALVGCESPDSVTTPGTDATEFEVVKPAAFDGNFNPDGLEVGTDVGLLAPEINGEDLDGVPFKLSDYRGKVVMLDFYGDW